MLTFDKTIHNLSHTLSHVSVVVVNKVPMRAFYLDRIMNEF